MHDVESGERLIVPPIFTDTPQRVCGCAGVENHWRARFALSFKPDTRTISMWHVARGIVPGPWSMVQGHGLAGNAGQLGPSRERGLCCLFFEWCGGGETESE